ncbi:hypothetical protein HY768_09300 [candidate division TA06 bacterium]|uniref:Uncharacterized protein n=1 Tax=candidate division TA06 bacterium TaxID=2250710 RepID=A0A933IBI5_UNCT6|nr:hypothetical protein [candidate division TA06 bacterium]
MTIDTDESNIKHTILDIFQRYAPEAPEDTIRKIEQTAGLKLEAATPENVEPFLEAMRVELSKSMEDWKTRFVTGVLRQMINKRPRA